MAFRTPKTYPSWQKKMLTYPIPRPSLHLIHLIFFALSFIFFLLSFTLFLSHSPSKKTPSRPIPERNKEPRLLSLSDNTKHSLHTHTAQNTPLYKTKPPKQLRFGPFPCLPSALPPSAERPVITAAAKKQTSWVIRRKFGTDGQRGAPCHRYL